MNEVVLEQKARSPRQPRPFVRGVMLVLALVLVVGAILFGRGWRPTATTASGASAATSMPTSAAIEAKYGVRFTSVDITAGGGMIQLQYQIIDSDKTLVIHDAASAPFVIDANGVEYADPGMVGHSHVGKTKVAGTSDYILLANAKGGVKSGSIVTIKVGDLELRNVRAL